MSDVPPDALAETRARLARSRESLLAALAGVTERDFQREVDGSLLVERLAELARQERDTVASARRLVAEAGETYDVQRSATDRPAAERPATLPPQAIHALAGARHRATRLLDELAAAGGSGVVDERARAAALALLDDAAEREQRVSMLIEERA